MSKEKFDLVKSILQHYHDDAQQFAAEFPLEVEMTQQYLAMAAQDLGLTLKTSDDLAELLACRLDDMQDDAKEELG